MNTQICVYIESGAGRSIEGEILLNNDISNMARVRFVS